MKFVIREMWIKELYELTLCITYKDIENNPKINPIIKKDFL